MFLMAESNARKESRIKLIDNRNIFCKFAENNS